MSFLLHSWDIYGYVKSLKGTATSPGFEGLRLMPQRLNETDIRYIWSWRWWVKWATVDHAPRDTWYTPSHVRDPGWWNVISFNMSLDSSITPYNVGPSPCECFGGCTQIKSFKRNPPCCFQASTKTPASFIGALTPQTRHLRELVKAGKDVTRSGPSKIVCFFLPVISRGP